MAGIIHKIEETLGVGGHKDDHEKHKEGEKHHYGEEHKKEGHSGEHKEGVIDKIKDKIHGEGGEHHEHKDEKKKKKEKKKHEHGHEHGHSSSSDSDSD
ncbi:protein SRC1-like [Coffea eugenioides]|uniref:Dehydrin HIRD11 n=1 Tax=Coffea arabica TaxID=13443 RepID=A0A6P6T3B9_COFAR|nr:protein SRC1-like [Coffea arabica]XP_027175233.1 protein SRC1-like [Coffea eugenioides]